LLPCTSHPAAASPRLSPAFRALACAPLTGRAVCRRRPPPALLTPLSSAARGSSSRQPCRAFSLRPRCWPPTWVSTARQRA
jgi:hypothetical protein